MIFGFQKIVTYVAKPLQISIQIIISPQEINIYIENVFFFSVIFEA